MAKPAPNSPLHLPLVGCLAWLWPGLGHLYVGDKRRGKILMVAMLATFWLGVLIGGTRGTVDLDKRGLWFLAQIGAGGQTAIAWGLHQATAYEDSAGSKKKLQGHWLGIDIGVQYTGVAGLLNLLIIIDAMGRAESMGRGGGSDRQRMAPRSGAAP